MRSDSTSNASRIGQQLERAYIWKKPKSEEKIVKHFVAVVQYIPGQGRGGRQGKTHKI